MAALCIMKAGSRSSRMQRNVMGIANKCGRDLMAWPECGLRCTSVTWERMHQQVDGVPAQAAVAAACAQHLNADSLSHSCLFMI